ELKAGGFSRISNLSVHDFRFPDALVIFFGEQLRHRFIRFLLCSRIEAKTAVDDLKIILPGKFLHPRFKIPLADIAERAADIRPDFHFHINASLPVFTNSVIYIYCNSPAVPYPSVRLAQTPCLLLHRSVWSCGSTRASFMRVSPIVISTSSP